MGASCMPMTVGKCSWGLPSS